MNMNRNSASGRDLAEHQLSSFFPPVKTRQ